MNAKLFKKLNDFMEVNSVKNAVLTESEKANIEKELIFGNIQKELATIISEH